MGASVRPEPDNWLIDETRRRMGPPPSTQLGPQSPFAPSDATAVRTRPRQATARDYARASRQAAGGVAESVARLPTDLASLATLSVTATPDEYELVTVGRGQVRSRPRTRPAASKRVVQGILDLGTDAARAVGDFVGGEPQNESDESFRTMGDIAGSIFLGDAVLRAAPRVARAVRGGRTVAREAAALPEVAAGLDDAGNIVTNRGRPVNSLLDTPARPEMAPTPAPTELFGTPDVPTSSAIAANSDEILRRASEGGFTFNPREGRFLESGGYMVGGVPGQRGAVVAKGEDVAAALRQFERDNAELLAQPGMQAGGWVDDQGRFHIDVSQEAASAEEAQRLMAERNEMAAWHLDSMSELPNTQYNAATRADHATGLLDDAVPAAAVPEAAAPARGLFDLLPKLDESGRIGAYHGSPHRFDKFSLEKIGTGEGAQAYGHGLYFADDEAVARHYRETLSPRQVISEIKLGDRRVGTRNGFDYSPRPNDDMDNLRSSLFEDLLLNENEVAAAQKDGRFQQYVLDRLDRRIAELPEEWPEAVPAAQQLRKELARKGAVSVRGDFNPGGLYKVDIDADAEHFLDWDKPLAEQPTYVRERLEELDPDSFGLDGASYDPGVSGENIYNLLSENLGAKDASRRLRDYGIIGNRYLDGSSRAAGKGKYNYVVFDDSKVSITERGAGALPMLGTLGLLSGGALTAAAATGLLDDYRR